MSALLCFAVPVSLIKKKKTSEWNSETRTTKIKIKPPWATEFAHKAFVLEDSMLFSYTCITILQLVLTKSDHKENHSQRENVCCCYYYPYLPKVVKRDKSKKTRTSLLKKPPILFMCRRTCRHNILHSNRRLLWFVGMLPT